MSTNTSSVPKTKLAPRPQFKEKYDHYIDGKWVAPASGTYFDNISPIDGKVFTQAARGNAKDVDKAVNAAQKAFGLGAGVWTRDAHELYQVPELYRQDVSG